MTLVGSVGKGVRYSLRAIATEQTNLFMKVKATGAGGAPCLSKEHSLSVHQLSALEVSLHLLHLCKASPPRVRPQPCHSHSCLLSPPSTSLAPLPVANHLTMPHACSEPCRGSPGPSGSREGLLCPRAAVPVP